MLNAIEQIKTALAKSDIAEHLDHYLVQGGRLYATNSRVLASTPWPHPEQDYLVNGRDLEKALSKLGGNCTLTREEGKLVLKRDRFRATIPTLDPELFRAVVGGMEGATHYKLEPNFCDALRRIRPFISDNATRMFAMCIQVHNGKLYTTNNISVVELNVPGLDPELDLLMPAWAVDFILDNTDAPLLSVTVSDRAAFFEWQNGLNMRSQLVTDLFPLEQILHVLESWEQPTFQVSDVWLTSLLRVAELADHILTIEPERVYGSSEKGSIIEAEIHSPAPETGYSRWDSRYFLPVLNEAEYINLTRYPAPCPFSAHDVRGVVIGRN